MFFAFAWLFVFYPRSRQIWTPARRVPWAVGPIVTSAVIIVVWTAGVFTYRFDRSLDELDACVESLDAGVEYRAGVQVDDFTIVRRTVVRGCAHAFQIEGWHERDDRWIAYCPAGDPGGDGVE